MGKMSKVYVDTLPSEPCECPFSIFGYSIRSVSGIENYKYACKLSDTCDLCKLNYPTPTLCDYLVELPKN